MFKNQLNPTRLILIGICLLLLIVGCQQVISENNEEMTITKALPNEQATLPSVTAITPTHLIAQTPTPTWTPIPSLTSSPTSQPTLTPLPTEPITPTPWPTLLPDEAVNMVLSLLRDNQNPDCLLPCWWGATPGQTQWLDVLPYLQSFSLQTYAYPQDSLYVIAYSLPSNISYLEELHIGYTYNASHIITSIDIPSINIEGYDAKTMITLYGVPDEVWLKTFSELLPGEVLPFQLIVIYQEQGISFRYYVDAIRTDETVTACFEPGVVELERPDLFPVGPRIYVWEPGQYKTIDEIANIPQETYFPLEEKTDLTSETLYEKFTNPSEQPCIDTPADLWR